MLSVKRGPDEQADNSPCHCLVDWKTKMGQLLLYPAGIGLACRSSVAGRARGCWVLGAGRVHWERPVSIVESQA